MALAAPITDAKVQEKLEELLRSAPPNQELPLLKIDPYLPTWLEKIRDELEVKKYMDKQGNTNWNTLGEQGFFDSRKQENSSLEIIK